MKQIFLLLVVLCISIETQAQKTSASDAKVTSKTIPDSIKAFNVRPEGIEFGYVNKQFVTDLGKDGTFHENLFGEEGKFLHGMQIGYFIQPTLLKPKSKIGLGLRTGFYTEIYASSGKNMGYDNYQELDIHIPLNLALRISLSQKFTMALYGGIGMNYIVKGWLSTGDRTLYMEKKYNNSFLQLLSGINQVCDWIKRCREYESESIDFGSDGWPKRFNANYEFGLAFYYDSFYIRATYLRGLTNHCFYNTGKDRYMTRERKLSISFGVLLN